MLILKLWTLLHIHRKRLKFSHCRNTQGKLSPPAAACLSQEVRMHANISAEGQYHVLRSCCINRPKVYVHYYYQSINIRGIVISVTAKVPNWVAGA